MATIRPFRAVRYNSQKVDLSSVISQPYDRVRYGLQERYYALSPHNVVRIIEGKDQPDAYARAKSYYDLWRADQVLLLEEAPALYVYHQTFTVNGQSRTRKALVAALRLAPFDEGIVLPHEGTHPGPKEDRLRLLRTLEVSTGQIFLLYPDPENVVTSLLDAAISQRAPDVDAVELYENDVRQQLWVVDDPGVIQAVQCQMAPMRNLIIADGHHRYETALNYRDERRSRDGPSSALSSAAYNYCMAALVGMDDPGLTILPTHREILNNPHLRAVDILARAGTLFEVSSIADMGTCLAEMAANEHRRAFGLFMEGRYHLLVLKDPDLIEHSIPENRSIAWKSLDVSIAHSILLEQVIGLSHQAVELQTDLRYHRDPQLAIDNVRSGEGNLVLLLNPTRIDQVKACAQEAVKMPPKSTDFYPKMVAGLTMMPVGSEEQL